MHLFKIENKETSLQNCYCISVLFQNGFYLGIELQAWFHLYMEWFGFIYSMFLLKTLLLVIKSQVKRDFAELH